jgi:hypothetical protein
MLKVKTSEKVLPTVEAVKVSPKCALKPRARDEGA